MKTTDEIIGILKRASYAYYNTDEVTLQDDEFDALKDEIQRREPNHPFLKEVGAPPSSIFPEIKHEMPMGSLLKVNTVEEYNAWVSSYTGNQNLHWSEKLDGFSVSLTYEKGKFQYGLTRGDGITGEDITPNLSKIPNIPKKIAIQDKIHVRGEAMITLVSFSKNFVGKKNPRNALGVLRKKSGEGCEFLHFYAHNIDGVEFETEQEKSEFLKKLGFTLPNWGLVSPSEVPKVHANYETQVRSQIPYEIDGLVIRENSLSIQKKYGEVDQRPKSQRAFKFKALEVETVIKEVVWQTGRTGLVTPVGILEPTDIGGITVSRVSLCNFTEIQRLGLGLGATAILQRANDVIPKLLRTTKAGSEIAPPQNCTSCNSSLEREEGDQAEHFYCCNPECPAQIAGRFLHFLSAFGVKGLGDVIVEKLIQTQKLKELPDLFRLSVEDIATLDRIGEKVGTKIVNEIESKCRVATLPKFIECLGIPAVGEGVTKILLQEGYNLDKMLAVSQNELLQIHGIGDYLAEQTVLGLKNNFELIQKMRCFIEIEEPKKVGDSLKGKSFCFTGFRSKDMEDRIQSLGGTIASGVSKKTTYLVCKDPNEGTSKLQKARDVGCIIITPDELLKILG